MEAKRLKPCPFCGKRQQGEWGPGPYISRSQTSKFLSVTCPGCCSIAYGETESKVIKRWNTRVRPTPPFHVGKPSLCGLSNPKKYESNLEMVYGDKLPDDIGICENCRRVWNKPKPVVDVWEGWGRRY